MIKNFLAYDLAAELFKQCEAIKAKRHIKDQLSRASLSIVLNLAEGSAKPTPAEQRRDALSPGPSHLIRQNLP